MLLEKIQELADTRKRDERKAAEAKLASQVAAYVQHSDTMVKVIEAVPVLADLGFDVETVRATLAQVPHPVPAHIELDGQATINGYNFATRLTYEDSVYPQHRKIAISIDCKLGDEYARGYEKAIVDADAIEALVVKLVADALGIMADRLKNAKVYREQVIRKRAIAVAFVACAREHVALWDEYKRLTKEWLVSEGARLWQPWSAYEIRLVPLRKRITDEDGYDVVETALILEQPQEVAAKLVEQPLAEVTVIEQDGALSRQWIGGLLRVKEVHFEAPARDYHRRFALTDEYGSHDCIYASPLNGDMPAARPVRPPYWREYLAQRMGNNHSSGDYTEVYRFFERDGSRDIAECDASKIRF